MHKLLSILALIAAAGLTGCADTMVIGNESGDPRFLDTNFYSLEHAFTDEGAASAKARADNLCKRNKRLAVQAERGCTLDRCVTHFQCVTPKDVKDYGL